jgi:hypothetical protein
MSRPSDWSPVGLDSDPTPGDPVLVLSGGQEYQEVARSIDNAASAMSRLDVDGTISQAVDSLMSAKEDTIGEIRKAHSRYVAAGDALVGYASALERVQSETLAALERARDAQDAAQAASGSKDRWQELADSAKDETEKQEFQQKADQAGGDAEQAQSTINSAQGSIESAVSDRDRAANHAVDQIEEITSSDDLNDGWWDNWGSKLVAAIADIADMISTIAGILAIVVAFIPVVGTALAGVLIVIAAVAAIVSAVANITLAATGERSWAEAGLAIAGAALSLIGLGGAAKAAMGLSKSIAKSGGFRQAMKGAWCKFGFGKCFVAGTLIHTPDGPRPIEEIWVGDKVWAHDLVTGRDELQLVVETFVRSTTELFHLTVAGATVSTTAEHPFMVHGRGWIDAAFLKAGDLLVTAEGTMVPVEAIETERRDDADAETVYNFHVETHSNYYVHAGDTLVLVHNAGHVKVLDVGTYSDLKKTAKVGDNLEHDHIPSSAALKKAKEQELGRKLTPQEAREVHEQGLTIEVPKDVHAQGDTYKWKNTPEQIKADAADLSAAAERDYATQSQNLINAGYKPEDVAAAIDKMRAANNERGI